MPITESQSSQSWIRNLPRPERWVGSGSFEEDRVSDLSDLQPVVPRQCLDGLTGIDTLHQSPGGDPGSRYGRPTEGDAGIDHNGLVRSGPLGAEGVEPDRKGFVIAFDSRQVQSREAFALPFGWSTRA